MLSEGVKQIIFPLNLQNWMERTGVTSQNTRQTMG